VFLVNDFSEAINRHRSAHVNPAETLCVDESISKWYGKGGGWTSVVLPMYVAIDRKPENGRELQNVACGRIGIMMHLSIVTTAADQAANLSATDLGVPHCTAVLQQLVAPSVGSGCIVCADSYFSSTEAAEELLSLCVRFIGVVKTAHRLFPMERILSRELRARGDNGAMVHVEATGTADMMATLWFDRSRR